MLDDEAQLEEVLASLGNDRRIEIIVVNGGKRTPALMVIECATPHVRS